MVPTEREAVVRALRASAGPCIEQALLRANSVAPSRSKHYVSQSGKSIQAVYEHVVEVLNSGPVAVVPIPLVVLAQARLAAICDVTLDSVLRRCMAVNHQIGLHLTAVVNEIKLSYEGRIDVAQRQVQIFERVVEGVIEEYGRAESSGRSTESARLELVKRVLKGEALDVSGLGYGLERHHTALVAEGVDDGRLKELAAELAADVLLVRPGASVRWLWMATPAKPQPDAVRLATRSSLPDRCTVAIGTSEAGQSGWRTSHMQANAAFGVARRTGRPTHYGDVMLIASTLCDHELESALRREFLNPLKAPPRGGDALLETLRAYFAADRNGTSAAAALEVSRQTVSNRLQLAEHRLGRSLSSCAPEVELALRLDELDRADLCRSADRHQRVRV
jgi:DNA-binding PucR family transcriptional regulator